LKALLIDYLTILGYLIVLAIVIAGIYFFLLDGIPEFTESKAIGPPFNNHLTRNALFYYS